MFQLPFIFWYIQLFIRVLMIKHLHAIQLLTLFFESDESDGISLCFICSISISDIWCTIRKWREKVANVWWITIMLNIRGRSTAYRSGALAAAPLDAVLPVNFADFKCDPESTNIMSCMPISSLWRFAMPAAQLYSKVYCLPTSKYWDDDKTTSHLLCEDSESLENLLRKLTNRTKIDTPVRWLPRHSLE